MGRSFSRWKFDAWQVKKFPFFAYAATDKDDTRFTNDVFCPWRFDFAWKEWVEKENYKKEKKKKTTNKERSKGRKSMAGFRFARTTSTYDDTIMKVSFRGGYTPL